MIQWFFNGVVISVGNKCLELWGPEFLKSIKWGHFSIIDFDMDFGWKGDHAPRFRWYVALLGSRLLEVSWYDIRHEDDVQQETGV